MEYEKMGKGIKITETSILHADVWNEFFRNNKVLYTRACGDDCDFPLLYVCIDTYVTNELDMEEDYRSEYCSITEQLVAIFFGFC
jgi:hypothetical protein